MNANESWEIPCPFCRAKIAFMPYSRNQWEAEERASSSSKMPKKSTLSLQNTGREHKMNLDCWTPSFRQRGEFLVGVRTIIIILAATGTDLARYCMSKVSDSDSDVSFCFDWAVLQAEVAPCLLIDGTHKFHIRTYMVVVENLSHPDLLEMFVYNRHEVRIASTPVTDDPADRDRQAHITNGSASKTERRELLENVPELVNRGLKDNLETFVSATFGLHLLPDILGRVKYAASQDTDGARKTVRKFAVAGIDTMVCSDDRIYLLEVNVNPSAPPESLVDTTFRSHLTGFMQDMIDLITEKPYQNFTLARDLLQRKGMLD
jgi:Tubulin-tyrosine ligase family